MLKIVGTVGAEEIQQQRKESGCYVSERQAETPGAATLEALPSQVALTSLAELTPSSQAWSCGPPGVLFLNLCILT